MIQQSLYWYLPRRFENSYLKRYFHTNDNSSIIHSGQDMEACEVSYNIDDWLKKLWYIYTREYYSAIRRYQILPFAATWMDLQIIMLSNISQTEKVENHMISLTGGI